MIPTAPTVVVPGRACCPLRWLGRAVLRAAAVTGLALAGTCWAQNDTRWALLTEPVFHPLDAKASDIPADSGARFIAQDGLGFLWIASYNGLSRWDGNQLRTYRLSPGAPNSLPQSLVQALTVDADGQLWIGATAGALARYDPRQDRFVAYPLLLGGATASETSVNRVLDDGAGGLWLATDAGLVHVDRHTGATRLERRTPTPAITVFVDRDRGLWLATRGTLLHRRAGQDTFDEVALPMRPGQFASVTVIMQDRGGHLWLGTDGAGAFVSLAGQDRFTRVTGPAGRALDVVPALLEVRPGVIWLGTDNHGILQVSAERPHLRYIEHDPMRATSLDQGIVFSLLRDASGEIWVGTDRSVARMDTGSTAFQTLFGVNRDRWGLNGVDAPALEADAHGRIWIGTSQAGVLIVEPVSGAMRHIAPDPNQPERALPRKFITAFATDPRGGMFIGTTQGLYRADAQGQDVQRVEVAGRSVSGRVNRLFTDAAGDLWVGGSDGLHVLPNPRRARTRPEPHNPDLADQRIAMLDQRDADSLWVGTNNGLAWLDLRTGHMTAVASSRSAMGMVTSLLKEGDDRLWVGTLGHGLHLLQRHDAHWRTAAIIDSRRGLANDNINMILRADDGGVWVSTDEGLARIDPYTLSTQAFTGSDGVAITTYWTRSGARPAPDELLFGGIGGITIIHPSRLRPWSYQPRVVITDVRVGGQLRWVPPDGDTEAVVVPAEDNSLSVGFASLDLSAPQQNLYRYWLEGFDSRWTQVSASSRHANYTNLPPGRYTLHVRGSNRTGAWSDRQIALRIEVQPKWYQTMLARVGQWLLAGLLVLGLMQLRTLRLRRQTARLEQLVELRTAELQQSRQRMQHLAYMDSLTGLPNRRDFNERMTALTAHGKQVALVLLLIDLDQFKAINDTLGHDAGDALLATVSNRMGALLGNGDSLARLGGDEFAVTLESALPTSAVEAICRRLITAIAQPVPHAGKSMQVSASIGLARFPQDGQTPDALYKAADTALYAAKRAGRGTWRWASGLG